MGEDDWQVNEPTEGARQKYLITDIGGQAYGIPIEYVEEIASRLPVLAVEGAPGCIAGKTGVRGRQVPVADLRKLLGLASEEGTQTDGVVIVNAGGMSLGLVTGDVKSMAEFDDAAIMTPPAILGESCVSGIVKRPEGYLLLLDCSRLLPPEEAEALRAWA